MISKKPACCRLRRWCSGSACLAVGIAGLRLRYPRPRPAEKPQAPVVAQVMHVELTNDSSPPPPDVGPPDTPPEELAAQPPAMPDAPVAPPAPALIAVATPSPAIAFALPTEGPTRIVEPKAGGPRASSRRALRR